MEVPNSGKPAWTCTWTTRVRAWNPHGNSFENLSAKGQGCVRVDGASVCQGGGFSAGFGRGFEGEGGNAEYNTPRGPALFVFVLPFGDAPPSLRWLCVCFPVSSLISSSHSGLWPLPILLPFLHEHFTLPFFLRSFSRCCQHHDFYPVPIPEIVTSSTRYKRKSTLLRLQGHPVAEPVRYHSAPASRLIPPRTTCASGLSHPRASPFVSAA